MNDGQKRRHIRDIAHLYISGSRDRAPAPRVTLLIVGENRACFSGFHAANLAAALSARGCSVRVSERSGLLPNAGFYLALSPSQYIRWDDAESEPVAGLAGVMIDCANGEFEPSSGESHRPRVDLVHVPPSSDDKSLETSLRLVDETAQPLAIMLIVDFDQAPPGTPVYQGVPACLAERLKSVATFVLHSSDRANEPRIDDPSVCDLGTVVGWESALGDRVPPVVRAPSSALSSAYFAVADNVLIRMNELRRKSVGPPAIENSAGDRSGGDDSRHDPEGSLLQVSRFGMRYPRRGPG